jgi:Kelch motif protein
MILIATRYMQQTSGDIPPQLTLFCSVVAAAADNSSYNIYIYGGYDGVDATYTTSDDVYVLSIPSFTWVKVYSGTSAHGRIGHKCVKVYPDQMFILGGIPRDSEPCLEGGIIQVFNLNTLKFQDSYSPTTWSEYKVPSLVTAQIGGK